MPLPQPLCDTFVAPFVDPFVDAFAATFVESSLAKENEPPPRQAATKVREPAKAEIRGRT
jgi:hypothetical protein